MDEKQEREPVHFGYLSRRLMECLPDVGFREDFIAPTIQALYAYSNTFFLKEDLDAGKIHFTGTVSYDQLARHMKSDREAAKDRCEAVRDRWGILSWKRTKYGINYTVSYKEPCRPWTDGEVKGCRRHGPYDNDPRLSGWLRENPCPILSAILAESGSQTPISEPGVQTPISNSSQGSGASSQGLEPVEIGVGSAESGVRTPPLSSSVLKETVEDCLSSTNLSKDKDQNLGETPNPQKTKPRLLSEIAAEETSKSRAREEERARLAALAHDELMVVPRSAPPLEGPVDFGD